MTNDDLIAQFDAAQNAHAAWKVRLLSAIQDGDFDLPPSEIARCDRCAFGQWLEGDALPPDVKASKPYLITYGLHREFHKSAAHVVDLAINGDTAAAKQAISGDYAKWSGLLDNAISKWKQHVQEH